MSNQKLLPLATELNVITVEPLSKLWHIPKVQKGYCPGCERKIEKQMLTFQDNDWHPECFRCSLCREPFVDNKCVPKGDLILHEQCFKKCFEDRCAVCNDFVSKNKNKMPMEALGKIYHAKCFKCTRCKANLGQGAFISYYNMPYCKSCYEEMTEFFPVCLACHHPINESNTEFKTFFFQGTKYYVHASNCYKCLYCPEDIGPEENCRVHDNHLICKNCYIKGLSKICADCNEPIFDQGSNMGSVYWHTQHFKCSVCHQALKPDSCEFRYGVLKCKGCAMEDKPKCAGCGKPIGSNAIASCGALWHPNCLVCNYCQKKLIGTSFSKVRGKPCCTNCFKKLLKEKKIDQNGEPIMNQDKKKKSKSDKKHHHHHHKKDDDEENSDSEEEYDEYSDETDSGSNEDSK